MLLVTSWDLMGAAISPPDQVQAAADHHPPTTSSEKAASGLVALGSSSVQDHIS